MEKMIPIDLVINSLIDLLEKPTEHKIQIVSDKAGVVIRKTGVLIPAIGRAEEVPAFVIERIK